jgi:non-ribosomal peptide synthetase component F
MLAQQLGYWKAHLKGAPAALDLPTDRARPAVASFAGNAVHFALSRELSAKLAELGRREGVTLFMVLLAAYQLLLKALQRAGRHCGRFAGCWPLPSRTGRAGRLLCQYAGAADGSVRGSAFRELLRRVRKIALGAYAHQDLPFEKLVEELQPVRDLSRQPLFQVSLVLQNTPQEAVELPGLTLRPVAVDLRTSHFDLTLSLQETDAGLRGAIEYATDLFDRERIERLAGHFEVLLEGIVADPGRRLSELPLLGEAERHRLIEAWNATGIRVSAGQVLHELFGEQAARTPEAVAVVYEDQKLSYGELDRRTNRLAHHLRGLGVGPEVIVGLCVERSIEMVVGLLAILKAGGAYLPLDPSYPAERLAYIVADAKAAVVVTVAAMEPSLRSHDVPMVRLDTNWSEIAAHASTAPVTNTLPENLAYVIYTSGSTASRKAWQTTHRGRRQLSPLWTGSLSNKAGNWSPGQYGHRL